jgi:hypothetical protein
VGGADLPTISAHAFSQDATNSGVWHRSKLRNLRSQSSYSLHPARVKDTVDFQHWLHKSPVRFADTLRVQDGSAAGVLGLIRKQLQSIGCPTWDEEVSVPKFDGPASEFFQNAPMPRHIRLLFVTSDGAGDQLMARKIIKHVTWTTSVK